MVKKDQCSFVVGGKLLYPSSSCMCFYAASNLYSLVATCGNFCKLLAFMHTFQSAVHVSYLVYNRVRPHQKYESHCTFVHAKSATYNVINLFILISELIITIRSVLCNVIGAVLRVR